MESIEIETSMVKLKKVKLQNYCGYKEVEFDLEDKTSLFNLFSSRKYSQDGIKNWFMLYGPNGIGKSNFLNAVRMLSSPWEIQSQMRFSTDPEISKDPSKINRNAVMFRRITNDPDYQPGYESFTQKKNLYMEGIFEINTLTDDGRTETREAKVIFENNFDKKFSGVTLNELPEDLRSVCFYVDADNPINYQKFQLREEVGQEFLDFAASVYNFNCELPESCKVPVKVAGQSYMFYTDFAIHKNKNERIHYKKMSAGEKKIATLLSSIFDVCYTPTGKESRHISDANSIMLIDNIELHIYFKRHMKLIEKMNQYFPNHQVIATTHSPIIVKKMPKRYLADLERYVKKRLSIDYIGIWDLCICPNYDELIFWIGPVWMRLHGVFKDAI